MALSITFLGHSGFIFDDGTHKLIVDPFLTGNPLAKHSPKDVKGDFLALTHGHGDHFGDTLDIVKANNATVIAPFEICEFLGEHGISKSEPGNPGGRIDTAFGHIAFTPAIHSSSYNGRYMGEACGLIIHIGGVTIYHCGDTALFNDMKTIGELAQPQIACIPVGDRFTMGPELGRKAAELINAPVTIPIHYKTFPLLTDDISAFAPTGVKVRVMEPGETWQYA